MVACFVNKACDLLTAVQMLITISEAKGDFRGTFYYFHAVVWEEPPHPGA